MQEKKIINYFMLEVKAITNTNLKPSYQQVYCM